MADEQEGVPADWRDDIIRWDCKQAAETGNPLLLFRALKHALGHALERAIDEAEKAGAQGEEAVRAGFAADKSVRLPAELHRFLQSAMWRLCELEAGRDFRDLPAEHPHADAKWGTPEYDSRLGEWRAYYDGSKYGGVRVAPDAAAKLVSQALGITRPGFNAFLLSEKQNLAEIAKNIEHILRLQGTPATEARLEAMERLGYADERSVRRLKSGKPRGRGKRRG